MGGNLFSRLFKPKERWPGEAKMQARMNRAAFVWNSSDVQQRVRFLRNAENSTDQQLFQAYVQSPFSRLPYELQLKLLAVVVVFDSTPNVLE
jgi:hypothetical protein